MATSIGGTACDFLVGNPPPPRTGRQVLTSRRPGVDGLVAEKLGNRAGPFMLVATRIATSADMTTWLAALDALRGASPVTVETDDGETYTNCYIMDAKLDGSVVAVINGGVAKQKADVLVFGQRSAI